MYRDVCTALQTPDTVDNLAYDVLFSVCERIPDQTSEALHSSHGQTVPIWLACAYLGSNTMLSILNFYWFGKMIEAVSKRFKSPKEKTGQKKTKADGRISSVNTKTREEIELDGNYRATPRGNALRRDVNKSVTLRNSAPSIHS